MRMLLSMAVDAGRRAHLGHTDRLDGDMSPATVSPRELAERRRSIVGDARWHPLRQVHGSAVYDVAAPLAAAALPSSPPEADAAVTTMSGETLVVHTGDCVPVGFVHPAGVVAVAHAGWKGLEAGVLGATVDSVRAKVEDDRVTLAVVGPHIRAESYEFGRADLDRLGDRFGPHVKSSTSEGGPALDLTAATEHELRRLGVEVASVSEDCTALLADRYWSHRARGEAGRIAMVAWLETS